MNTVITDGFEFEFTDAISAFKFDETDKTSPHYHGALLKGVDIIAEFSKAYVYVEVKEYDRSRFDSSTAQTPEETVEREDNFNELKSNLKYKFRDTYLYRYAEQKVDKPINYICLVTFDAALNCTIANALRKELPVGIASPRWTISLANTCLVVNLANWNTRFPRWPVKRLPRNNTAGGTTP